MNKTELVAAAAEQTGMTKKDTEKALNAACDCLRFEQGREGAGQRLRHF